MGEFVRSASSTVEAPVERRLKEKLASEPPPTKKPAKKAAARRHPPPTPTAKQPRASLPRRWTRPLGQADGSAAAQLACALERRIAAPPEARPVRCPCPHGWTVRPRRTASRPAASRQPNQPTGQPKPRSSDAVASPRRYRWVSGRTSAAPPVRPADCRAVRDLGVAPGFHARVTTRSRPLRAWVSRAHLGPARRSASLVGRAHRWAVPPCREAGQACPACRGRIPP